MIPNRRQRRHPEMFGITLYAPDGDEGAGGGGGSATAVMDKPAAGLVADDAAAAAAAGDTKDDSKAKDDADVSGETKTGEGEKAKTPVLDEDGEKIAAARVAEALEAHKREQATLKEQQDAATAEEAHQAELRNHYTTHEKTLTEALDAIGVTIDGETYRLGKETRDQLLGVLKAYDAGANASIGLRLRDTLTNQVLAATPEADRAATKKALDAADPKDFAKAIGEAYAPRAAALQELDLDGVLGLSAKAKRGHAEAIKSAKDEAKKAERERIYALHGITQDEPDTGGTAAVGERALTVEQARTTPVAELAKRRQARR